MKTLDFTNASIEVDIQYTHNFMNYYFISFIAIIVANIIIKIILAYIGFKLIGLVGQ